ncbi:MAG TPA: T9SS type A sorting domain-containing protein, partial [Bacteroidales bacterium]|nr:T9SS type A sorting domain-containing protein [Bacteroidales bacterium]
SPTAGCLPTVPVPVSFTLKNLGVDTLAEGKAFDIAWFLDNDLISSERFLLDTMLLPGDSIAFTFTQLTSIETADEYLINVEIFSRDAEMANNSFGSTIEFHEIPDLQIPPQIVTNRPDTVVLNAGPGHISYLWDNGHTAQTRAVSDFGMYSVTVGNAFGCFTSGTILVVPELPDMGVLNIVSPTEGCIDDYTEVPVSINLINSGNVLVPEGAQINLQFSLNGTPVSAQELMLSDTLNPGEIVPFTFIQKTGFSSVGEDTIEVKLDYVNDTRTENDSLVQVVRVFPMPETNLPDSIISANPIGLVLQPNPGYASYLWHDGSTAPTFTIVSPLSQWYKVTVTNSHGCSRIDSVFVLTWDVAVTFLLNPRSNCVLSSEEQVIFVLQNRGPDTFYAGHSFRAGFSIGTQPVNWQDFILANNLSPMQVQTLSFNQKANLAETGTYQVRIIIEGTDVNMHNNSLLANILVSGAPVVNLGNDIYTMRPDTVILDAGAGFSSYLWGNGSTTRRFNVVNFGRYFVEVQDQFGCRASDTINVNSGTSAPSIEFFEKSILVFPNPATNFVTVQIDNQTLEWRQLEVINQTGSVIYSDKIDSPGMLQKKVNVGSFRPGVFYIRITGINASVVRKLIVQRRD